MASLHTQHKKPARPKKYGKQTKSHLSRSFGRNLWTATVPLALTSGIEKRDHDPDNDQMLEEDMFQEALSAVKSCIESANVFMDVVNSATPPRPPRQTEAPSCVDLDAPDPNASANQAANNSDGDKSHSQEPIGSSRGRAQKPSRDHMEESGNGGREREEKKDLSRTVPSEGSPLAIVAKDSPPRRHGVKKKAAEGAIDGSQRFTPLRMALSNGDSSTNGCIESRQEAHDVDDNNKDDCEGNKALEQALDVATTATILEGNDSDNLKHQSAEPERTQTPREDASIEGCEGEVNTRLSEDPLPILPEQSEASELLKLCSTPSILRFTEYIRTVTSKSKLNKLGEASYSEVFLQSSTCAHESTVLKVIPFGKPDQCAVREIVREVRITKTMSGVQGFIGYGGAYVVQGRFPEELMQAWDDYDESTGCENERPDFYEEDQLFVVILLENGGTDLEHFELDSWEEASEIFWRVARALAQGEKEFRFEHRDLHYGNVVIKREASAQSSDPAEQNIEQMLDALSLKETPGKGLKVKIIDYTLSRADCNDSLGLAPEFSQLDDPALFSGRGDYQFDIYRYMRKQLSSAQVLCDEDCIDWGVFEPKTNVFWLHYLANILVNKKGLPRPATRGRNALAEREIECYRRLEGVFKAIDPRKKRFGKSVAISSAEELLEWALEEHHISCGHL